jgi:hypothetical protein
MRYVSEFCDAQQYFVTIMQFFIEEGLNAFATFHNNISERAI